MSAIDYPLMPNEAFQLKNCSILAIHPQSKEIHTLRRLQDQKEFSIGDNITNGTTFKGRLQKFSVDSSGNVTVYSKWSNVGMPVPLQCDSDIVCTPLENIRDYVVLPAMFQPGAKVNVIFLKDELPGTILSVHFHTGNTPKYDIELQLQGRMSERITRIYNIESEYVKHQIP